MDFAIQDIKLNPKYNDRDFSGYEVGTTPNYGKWGLSPSTLCANFYGLSQVFSAINRFKKNERYVSSKRETSDTDWVEFSTWEKSLKALKTNPQHFSKFKANDLVIQDFNEAGNEVSYDVVGDYIDVGKFVEGVPEVFGQMHMGAYRGRYLRIFMQGGGACGVTAERFSLRAKRVVRLVDWLENQGVRVSLNVVYSNDNGHADIKVKAFDEPLNIFDIGVATSPDFFRRVMFYFKEQSKTVDGTYGYANEFTDRARNNLKYKELDEAFLLVTSDTLANSWSDVEVNEYFDRLETLIADRLSNNEFNQFMEV